MNSTVEVSQTVPNREAAVPAIATIVLTVAGDLLLWHASLGLSCGILLILIAATLFWIRPHVRNRRATGILATALLATAVQAAIQTSFVNLALSLVILVALTGEAAYPQLQQGWDRWSEAAFAFLKCPGRWAWAGWAMTQLGIRPQTLTQGTARAIKICFPAVLAGGVFLLLFCSGNAVFNQFIGTAWTFVLDWVRALDISFSHLFFVGALATLFLVIIVPAQPKNATPRIWSRDIPRILSVDLSLTWWRCTILLAVSNAIFFFANTLDAVYLWTHVELPPGVNASRFLHQGVNSLVVAVLISAGLLVAIFQHCREISASRPLKRLGYLWVAQNLVLMASVVLRLKLYIDDAGLSILRVYVMVFLAVVAMGFALLTKYIAREKTLNWLLLSNGLAAFSALFLVQFADIPGRVARYNVAWWQADTRRPLDEGYIESLGASAILNLVPVAESGRPEAAEAKEILARSLSDLADRESRSDWRSWQYVYAKAIRELKMVKLAQETAHSSHQ